MCRWMEIAIPTFAWHTPSHAHCHTPSHPHMPTVTPPHTPSHPSIHTLTHLVWGSWHCTPYRQPAWEWCCWKKWKVAMATHLVSQYGLCPILLWDNIYKWDMSYFTMGHILLTLENVLRMSGICTNIYILLHYVNMSDFTMGHVLFWYGTCPISLCGMSYSQIVPALRWYMYIYLLIHTITSSITHEVHSTCQECPVSSHYGRWRACWQRVDSWTSSGRSRPGVKPCSGDMVWQVDISTVVAAQDIDIGTRYSTDMRALICIHNTFKLPLYHVCA